MRRNINTIEDILGSIKINEIQFAFKELISTVAANLHLKPLLDNKSYTIIIVPEEIKSNYPFDLGVLRESKKDQIIIKVSKRFEKFIPIILLREVYRIFTPPSLRKSVQIQIILYMLLEKEFERSSFINEWKNMIRAFDTYDYYFKNNYETLIKFFRLEDPESKETVIPFLFKYIRNVELISLDNKIFDRIVMEFLNMMRKSLGEEDVLETIRVIKKIFDKVKTYSALLHYNEIFKEMKENGEISTDLSLRKFTSNLRMLNHHSICSPIYKIDWTRINLSLYMIFLQFHPNIRWPQIFKFINSLPFFLYPRISALGFSRDLFGYIVIPSEYSTDLKQSLTFFKDMGYLVEYKLYTIESLDYSLNLNYFRNMVSENQFFSPKSKDYDDKFELNLGVKYSFKTASIKLSLLDFLILDRAKNSSFTGFGFERRESTLTDLKSDLLNEIINQTKLIERLKNEIDYFQQNPKIKSDFLKFLKLNESRGFFLIKKKLLNITKIAGLIPEILESNQRITSPSKLREILIYSQKLVSLEDKIILNDSELLELIFYEFLPLYSKSSLFFKEHCEKFSIFLDFFIICEDMKIFNLYSMMEMIKNFDLSSQIYNAKQEKLNLIYNQTRLREISSKEVESKLEEFATVDPPIIYPSLIESIFPIFFARQYFTLLIDCSNKNRNLLKQMSQYFPNFLFHDLIYRNQKHIYCEFGIPNLDLNERFQLLSLLNNKFGDSVILANRFIHPGVYHAYSRKNYYDFLNKKFHYTHDLFDQYDKYIIQIIGKEIPEIKLNKFPLYNSLWSNDKDFIELINQINLKRYGEVKDFSPIDLNKLYEFHIKLDDYIEDGDKYNQVKSERFFNVFVKKIRFKPIYRKFGLQEYYLYYKPTDFDSLDLKLLFINNFKSFKFIPHTKRTISFFIKYIFPANTPNKSYLNWLILSKKNVSSYLLFSIKKSYIHLDVYHNIDSEGWKLDFNQFNTHITKVLFQKFYKPEKIKEKIIIKDIPIGEDIGPDSDSYKKLLHLYEQFGSEPINLKKILNTKRGSKIEKIVKKFLNKRLISTYLIPNNLHLRDKLTIIIPDLNEEKRDILIDIFRYFNLVKLSEIEGEYYLNSFIEIKKFDIGLYIKISLPNEEISPYTQKLTQVFDFLEIDYYLMTTDLYDGSRLLNTIFPKTNFKLYNPLKNLLWNKIDKIWMNHKLFDEKFNPIYPALH